MKLSDSIIDKPIAPERRLFLVITITLIGAAMAAIQVANEPRLAIGGIVGILFLLAILKWPDVATVMVVFYIYANVSPVLVKFHGVPSYLAMGFPIILVVPVVWHLLLRREKIIITPVLLLILLLGVIYLLGAAYSSDFTLSSRKLIDFFNEGVLLYFLFTNLIRSPLMLKRVIWVLLFSGALIGGLSLYQQATGTFDNNYGGFAQVASSFSTGVENLQGEARQRRLAGPIGEQNRYAQNMLMLVPLGLFQLWLYRPSWARILSLILTSLIILGGALAFSRGAAVGFVLMILILVFLRYIKFYQLVLLVLGAALALWIFPQYGTRLATLSVFTDVTSTNSAAPLSTADGAIRGRATDITAALLIFLDHPLIGVGPGMVQYYTQDYSRDIGIRYITNNPQAHSLFPGIAAESGILGLICFILILFIPLRDLVRARKIWKKEHPDWAYLATGFLQVLISYIVTGLFLHLSYMRFFYMMLALAVVASRFKDADVIVPVEATEPAMISD